MKFVLRLITVILVLAPAAGAAAAPRAKKQRMLYISQSKGFVHGSVNRNGKPLAPSEESVTQIATESGIFEVECTQDASVLTPEKLKTLDVVMFYTTGKLPITPENFTAFEEWLKSGKAMIGAHSATDTFGDFKPYSSLINGTFDGHPWGAGETVTMTNHEPTHPTVKMLGEEFQWKDEIYQYRNYDPKSVRVLYSLNMAKCKTKAAYHVPVCWVREFGKGRLFYTNLGHNEGTWTNPKFKEHLLAGIRWALKLDDGPAEPNPGVQALEMAKSFVAVAGAEAGKNADELMAKVKAGAKDAAWLEKLAADIAAARRINAKTKDGDAVKAERARILAEIEKK